jgi:molybdopterin-biosynthesis enzyme MoeA-like protein
MQVEINNVFILPGIPRLYKAMISARQHRFVGKRHATKEVFTSKGEGDIADAVRKLAGEHPKVHVGSYPNADPTAGESHKVKVVLKSRDADKLDEAYQHLKRVLASMA